MPGVAGDPRPFGGVWCSIRPTGFRPGARWQAVFRRARSRHGRHDYFPATGRQSAVRVIKYRRSAKPGEGVRRLATVCSDVRPHLPAPAGSSPR